MTCRYLDVLDEVEEIFQTKVAIEVELEMNDEGSKWIKMFSLPLIMSAEKK